MEEDRALERLARVMTRVNEQEEVKENSARLLREEMDYFERKHREDFSIDFFKMYDMYVDRLREEARMAQEKLNEIRPALDEAREKVVEAGRGRRIVELLKERYKERYSRELRRAEKKSLEEAALLRNQGSPFKEEHGESVQPGGRDERFIQDDEETWERERELDALAEYYEKLGVPDPRGPRER